VDLDGDGHLDILSGSWPGELFFFRGGPNRSFAAPVKLKHKDGKTINIGGGLRPESGDMILIAGDAKFEKTDKGNVIIYEGQRIEVPEGKQAGITGTASAAHAVDWDSDGDMDLLVGEIGGNVYLVPNEGKPKAPSFGKERRLQAGGEPLHVQGDAGPFVADWDGDGKFDLLVGAGDGSVTLFRNTGTVKEPKLAAGEVLVTPGENRYGADAPKEPCRGHRSKICVADWNGDGRLDLLLGDFATQKPEPKKLTPEEQAEQDKLKKEFDAVQANYRKLVDKLIGSSRVKSKDEREKVEKEMKEVRARMTELYGKVPQEYENHGWVWLFLRKAAEPAAEAR
jgi:hypothetical protein